MKLYGVELINEGDIVVRSFKTKGYFEPLSITKWKSAIRTGMIALDVGSYTGLYALIASNQGAKVIAYEPNPFARKRLVENILLNGADVAVVPAAVGEVHSNGTLWLHHTDMTTAGRLEKREDGRPIPVEIVPLTCMEPVCAIKIDAEGYELPILRGAREILERDKPLVIAEALTEEANMELKEYMASFGYVGVDVDGRNIVFECP